MIGLKLHGAQLIDNDGRILRSYCTITKPTPEGNGFYCCQKNEGHAGGHAYDWWLPQLLRRVGWYRLANKIPGRA